MCHLHLPQKGLSHPEYTWREGKCGRGGAQGAEGTPGKGAGKDLWGCRDRFPSLCLLLRDPGEGWAEQFSCGNSWGQQQELSPPSASGCPAGDSKSHSWQLLLPWATPGAEGTQNPRFQESPCQKFRTSAFDALGASAPPLCSSAAPCPSQTPRLQKWLWGCFCCLRLPRNNNRKKKSPIFSLPSPRQEIPAHPHPQQQHLPQHPRPVFPSRSCCCTAVLGWDGAVASQALRGFFSTSSRGSGQLWTGPGSSSSSAGAGSARPVLLQEPLGRGGKRGALL